MIFETGQISPASLLERTGWEIKPEGACKDDRCVPLPAGTLNSSGMVDLEVFARQMNMPLVQDRETKFLALGPAAGGKALESASAPDFTLPDISGKPFTLSSLRGTKVLLVAWASW